MSREDEALAHLRRQYAGIFTDEAVEEHLRAYVGMEQAEELLALMQKRRPDARRLLDIGCGYGSFVLAARERGLDAAGVELAGFEIDWARGRLADERPGDDPFSVYVQGDAHSLPYPDGSFNAVSLWNVLEHVRDAGKTLAEASRVLQPGGSLFAIAPNYAAFRREAHYHVPWAPLLPRPFAVAYLRALGRNPSFYRDDVFPCTMVGTVRALRRAGLRVRDPRAQKLSDPSSINRPALRHALEWAGKAGLLGPLRVALRAQLVNPLAPTIVLEAVKTG